MKTCKLAPLFAFLLVGATVPSVAAGPDGNRGNAGRAVVDNAVAIAPITADDTDNLLWMREEEKLARDVYLQLSDQWRTMEFKNIARSEQRHFDAIGAKITLFGLADPALPAVGQFANDELQALYFSLLTAGNTSYIEALKVGATIEDMDIEDLMAAIEATANPALRLTYSHLLEGSKNHLRTFVSRLSALGVDYVPQYIDQILFDAIVGQ